MIESIGCDQWGCGKNCSNRKWKKSRRKCPGGFLFVKSKSLRWIYLLKLLTGGNRAQVKKSFFFKKKSLKCTVESD